MALSTKMAVTFVHADHRMQAPLYVLHFNYGTSYHVKKMLFLPMEIASHMTKE